MGLELTEFRPEFHGFRFANSFSTLVFPPIPLLPSIGPFGGLCGGMTFAALDYFFARRPVPQHTTADLPFGVPAEGSALWEFVLRRHLNSIGVQTAAVGVPLTVGPLHLNLVPGDPHNAVLFANFALGAPAALPGLVAGEVRKLIAAISSGRPVPVFLVKRGSVQDSHQAVAIGYDDSTSPVEIYLYDNRSPLSVRTLRVDSGTCVLDGAEPWDAFFVGSYTPVTPSYSDLVLTGSITAVPFPGTRRFHVQFTLENRGEAQSTVSELWALADPEPGTVPTQPIGALPTGFLAIYAFTFDFAALAGQTVALQAVSGDRGRGEVVAVQPGPGTSGTVQITVP
ncbi:hypothetical protein [Umezawaea sp. NPDC059074]|uniref:hypothetical protein n=1 Tax=Umezawaea sp. NPDC059074 TaxID=3346716 RepID=UPI00368292BE